MLGRELLEKKTAGPELDLVVFVAFPLSDKWDDAWRRLESENELVRDVNACNVRALVNGGSGCSPPGPGVGTRYLGFVGWLKFGVFSRSSLVGVGKTCVDFSTTNCFRTGAFAFEVFLLRPSKPV